VDSYLGQYASLGLMLLLGVGFVTTGLTVNKLLAPHNPAAEKLTTYECGVDPVGGDWAHTQIRYYLYAYLYVLFAVEAVFLFPWIAIVNKPSFGLSAAIEMGIFIVLLMSGLLYAWRKGALRWV
jgi:NADH-quinone oxidoreductase subunit A